MVSQNFGSAPVFKDFLEESPFGREANFFGRIPQGLSNPQYQQAQGLFQPTFSRYLGELGRNIIGGQAPTQSFTDYLSQSGPDFQRQLAGMPLQETLGGRLQTRAKFSYGTPSGIYGG